MPSQKTIGFIGLGIMGKPMAQHLIKAGFALTVQFLKDCEHLHAGLAIEIAGGLVGQNQIRFVHQRSSDRHPLLLPTRKLTGQVFGPIGQAHLLESTLAQARDVGARAVDEW